MSITKKRPKKAVNKEDWDISQESIVKAAGRELSKAELQFERLRSLEDEMLTRSLRVVRDTFDFSELDPGNLGEVPQEWIDKLGEVEARRKHRVAAAGWMSNKESPVAIGLAGKVSIGIIRARATEKAGPKTLNIQTVAMTSPPKVYDVIDVEDDN